MNLQAFFASHQQLPLILGPCSAESYQQLEQIIKELDPLKPVYIRAGVWKPRTRPGHFQGIGIEALDWMEDLARKYQIEFCTEVANAQHVEHCLKRNIRTLWIGARTTVNPFYVEEIAKALKGEQAKVMVKNPMNPDLNLWIGAIERVANEGIEQIAAIHRGFSFYGNAIYRNVPYWQIPIELKRKMPQIQMIIDISHIAGSVVHLREIAQIALDLNFDGIMAEVHHDPQKALSDADQQVTADFFNQEVLSHLVRRTNLLTESAAYAEIRELRNQIDVLDAEVITRLAKRMKLAQELGKLKKAYGISIFQLERWNEIVNKSLEIGKENGLNEEFIFSLIEAIHVESIQHQSKTMNQNSKLQ